MHIATTTTKMNFLTINCRKKAKNVICMADLYCTQTFFSTLYQIYFKIQATEPPLIFHFYLTWAKYLSEFSLITSCPQSVCLSVNFSHFHFLLQNHRTSFKLGTNYSWVQLLYPTQLVAEGIMFLTRPSVSQSVCQSVSPSVLFFLSAQLLWNRSTEFREIL